MRLNKLLQKDYTLSSLYYQIKLPLDVEILIPADDPVRLLSAFVEGMELSDLYQTYGKIKKNQATPRQLFKIMVYASMNRIYSSRDIETACRRDVNFMYLLEGKPAPDHATFARFISLHFAQCSKKTLAEVSKLLYSLGEISGKSIFIDGTKIESVANKYTFVWKKAVTKNQAKLFDKILVLVEECENLYGFRISLYFTSTNSILKFSSFPAISWLASKVMFFSSLAVTFTGNGCPYWLDRYTC